jgi:hypothetical protein
VFVFDVYLIHLDLAIIYQNSIRHDYNLIANNLTKHNTNDTHHGRAAGAQSHEWPDTVLCDVDSRVRELYTQHASAVRRLASLHDDNTVELWK